MMGRNSWGVALLVLVSLTLAACARYALVASGPTTVEGVLSVQPLLDWNRIASAGESDIGASDVWTIDGEGLHSLIFMLNVKDGESLLKPPGEQRKKLPKFSASMPLDEVAALFEATVTQVTHSSVFEFRSVAPGTVLGKPGLRMEFSYVDANSVDRSGLAVAVIADGLLNVISYQGTRLYHFQKYLPEVEHLIDSAMLSAKA
jgi:hypothetical protein